MNILPRETPRILLVEDDPVSARFLFESATGLPAQVVLAKTRAEALVAAISAPFDLLLLDANLPDGSGIQLLQELRQQGINTAALAHTADCNPQLHQQLLETGFIAVLQKPMPVATLLHALQQNLPAQALPTWNDATALAAIGGRQEHVNTLRVLFLQELGGQQKRIANAAQARDEATIRAELHRMAAACGFVGAMHLLKAVRQLQAAPLDADLLQHFDQSCKKLLQLSQ